MDRFEKEQFLTILEKYNAGNASTEEIGFLDAYYKAFSFRSGYTTNLNEKEKFILKHDLQNSLRENILVLELANSRQIKKVFLKRFFSVAAAVIVFCALGLLFYPKEVIVVAKNKAMVSSDIAPGGNKAVLTLSNGQKIILTDANNGTLAKQAGVQITKTADGQLVYTVLDDSRSGSKTNDQFNTIETPKGGQYQVRLPDGSNVWLNAASALTYPLSFASEKPRKVDLKGEGYFEIAKDQSRPFIVKTSTQEVEVLGTHFNINSYTDEPAVKTTLIEGRVKVSVINGKDKILKPGQQSALTGSNMQITNIDPELAVAWKNSQFVFESDDIRYIMRMVSRWYNVEVEYVGSVPDSKFGGAVSRFENVSEVLKSLESTGKVKFKIEGKRIIVTK